MSTEACGKAGTPRVVELLVLQNLAGDACTMHWGVGVHWAGYDEIRGRVVRAHLVTYQES